MKNIAYLFLLISSVLYAQEGNIETIYLNKKVSTHLLSKVNIDKIDLSTNDVEGVIHNPKIIAIKPNKIEELELGYVSLIGENYFIQYHLLYTNDINRADKRIYIDEQDSDYFLHPDFTMTNIDLYEYSLSLIHI